MRAILTACLLAIGCGGSPKVVEYAQPMRPNYGHTPFIPLDDVSPPFRRNVADVVDHDVLRDSKDSVGAKDKDPQYVISEANAEADIAPEEGDADGNTQVYNYEQTHSFEIYGCFKEWIDIMFAPNEQIKEALGDKLQKKLARGWMHGFTESGDGDGHVVNVMTIRPIEEYDGKRKMKIHTNVGPYTFWLTVLPREETRCMDTVRFRHPKREIQQLQADERTRKNVEARAATDGGCSSAAYEIEVLEGSPRWVPTMVWRTCDGDHARVHIQFKGDVSWSKIPALKSDGGVVDYRYVPEDHVMVVDGLFTRGMLTLGSKEQGYEKVSIKALKEPR